VNKIGLVHTPMLPALVRWTGAKCPKEEVRSMIGIVLVAHGRLGAEFRAALEHVAGPQKQIELIAIGPDDDIEERRQDIMPRSNPVPTVSPFESGWPNPIPATPDGSAISQSATAKSVTHIASSTIQPKLARHLQRAVPLLESWWSSTPTRHNGSKIWHGLMRRLLS